MTVSRPDAAPLEDLQSVLIHFDYDDDDLDDLLDLEAKMRVAVAAAATGMVDGNEIAIEGTDGTFFLYGPDADLLFATVRQIVQSSPHVRNTRAVLRYGGLKQQDAPVATFTLATH